jgi:ribonuclease T2
MSEITQQEDKEELEALLGLQTGPDGKKYYQYQRKKNFWSLDSRKKRWLLIYIFVLTIIIISDGLFFGILYMNKDKADHIEVADACYLEPACTYMAAADSQGHTNATGWSNTDYSQCCDICLPGTNATVCFNGGQLSCANKTGDADFDLLLLDEMWIPQYCRALSNNYDFTLSHLTGMQCAYSSNSLTIHGLWPNYIDGFPQCCNASGALYPLDPEEVTSWNIWPALETSWYDPTTSIECSTCYLLNHEWEKHGGCFSPGNPKKYFGTGLAIFQTLDTQNSYIESLAGTIVNTSLIQAQYGKRVSVQCDPKDPKSDEYSKLGIGIFAEIQTCWDRDYEQIDCPPGFSGAFSKPCPDQVILQTVLG